MPEISMKNMLASGVHFGHQTQRWNPKMRPFIFGPRNGIYIIDLEKTVTHARYACDWVKSVVAEGGKVLFVATKRQARQPAREAAEKAGMPFVTERWLGGTLTNFATIRGGVERLIQLETWKEDGTYDMLPKKETVKLERKRKKLEANLGGIRELKGVPAAMFVIDPETEKNAVREAKRLGVPVIALVDTNCDPDPIDFVIPGNDDAIKSVTLFADLIAEACNEGAALFEQRMRAQGGGAAKEKPAEAKADAAPPEAEGPVVEKVARRPKLQIPADLTEAELLADDPKEEKAEGDAAKATKEEKAEDKPADKPEDKKE